jgi:hypothetical protein
VLCKIAALEAKLEPMPLPLPIAKPKVKAEERSNISGFRIVQKWVSSKGKRYLKWYAVRQQEGKQVWIYVGEDAGKAEEKIREWMARHS